MQAPEHIVKANEFKKLIATYEQNKDLINVGAYQSGSDKTLDLAIKLHPYLMAFQQQAMNEQVDFNKTMEQLNDMSTLIHSELEKTMTVVEES